MTPVITQRNQTGTMKKKGIFVGGLGPQDVAQKEDQVGGALGQAAHEIREPVAPIRDINTDPVAILDELPLQVGAHAVKHLKLEIILGDLLRGCEANRLRDHSRIVGGDGVVKPTGKKHLHEPDVVAIDVLFPGERHFIRLLIRTFAKANAASIGQQLLDVLFAAIEIGLYDSSHGRIARSNTLDQLDSALSVSGTLHIHAKKIFV